MDRKIAGLLGAAAALTAVTAASAATEVPAGQAPAASYRDLLEPVPNALTALRADDARGTAPASEGARVAETVIVRHHHHHRWRRHHHHHHHHHHY
jgi:hypothetical protein